MAQVTRGRRLELLVVVLPILPYFINRDRVFVKVAHPLQYFRVELQLRIAGECLLHFDSIKLSCLCEVTFFVD